APVLLRDRDVADLPGVAALRDHEELARRRSVDLDGEQLALLQIGADHLLGVVGLQEERQERLPVSLHGTELHRGHPAVVSTSGASARTVCSTSHPRYAYTANSSASSPERSSSSRSGSSETSSFVPSTRRRSFNAWSHALICSSSSRSASTVSCRMRSD